MDPKAEYELYQRFNEMVQGKTAVYISHRLSSAKFCDVIAVFRNGQIIEYGTVRVDYIRRYFQCSLNFIVNGFDSRLK